MMYRPPERLNIADHFLDARVREGHGDRPAIRTDDGVLTYGDVQSLASRFGNALRELGVDPEQRVVIALPDVPEFAAAIFGVLKIGGVVVMVNPAFRGETLEALLDYVRPRAIIADAGNAREFRDASRTVPRPPDFLVRGEDLESALGKVGDALDAYDSHRDDAAVWLFSGGTTGRPKAVVQSHRSFAYTTECYGKGILGLGPSDVTLAVPKLYFGYATGSNLFFPFRVGASCVLFAQRCTAEALFERIARHRPTVLVNVPTMINHMVGHSDARAQDLSSLRVCTSAGEALPPELHARWDELYGVELLDGLGTAEMWHVFLSNRLGDVHPGTLGRVVPGFEVRVCDDGGDELPHGEIGRMWVRGGARATCYWQNMEKTHEAFRGEWYASRDMVVRDESGIFSYRGRGDDMLKVSGKWLSPAEVENCLLRHPDVREVAVVGVSLDGLTKPHAFVVADDPSEALGTELQAWVKKHLAPYKYPRQVVFLDDLPRTHLGKVDRGRLKRTMTASRPGSGKGGGDHSK